MAGSKRTNIHGYTVVASADVLILLRRESTAMLSRVFREAQEHGQSHLLLGDTDCIVSRRSDHTYTVEPRGESLHTGLF